MNSVAAGCSALLIHLLQVAHWALSCRQPKLERMQEALAAAWYRSSLLKRALAAWRSRVLKLSAVRRSLATGDAQLCA